MSIRTSQINTSKPEDQSSHWGGNSIAPRTKIKPRHALGLMTLTAALVVASLMIGVAEGSSEVLNVSRIPRTVAALLTGSSLALAGMIMQSITRNRFVSPSTVGSTESAAIGLVGMFIFFPAAPMWLKALVAAVTAGIGTLIFLQLVSGVRARDNFTVPLIGIIYGGVIGAVGTFFAVRHNLLQSLTSWQLGSFAGVVQGRYELLWVLVAIMVGSWFIADQLCILQLGHAAATNLGLRVKDVERLSVLMVATVAAVTVAVVGMLPFVGLIVPNIVRSLFGDNTRVTLPWVALIGGSLTLVCDIVARTIIYPMEMPIGAVLGVVGAVVFLAFLLRMTYSPRGM